MTDAEQYRYFYSTWVLIAVYVISVEVATFHIIIANQTTHLIEIDTHYTNIFFLYQTFSLD